MRWVAERATDSDIWLHIHGAAGPAVAIVSVRPPAADGEIFGAGSSADAGTQALSTAGGVAGALRSWGTALEKRKDSPDDTDHPQQGDPERQLVATRCAHTVLVETSRAPISTSMPESVAEPSAAPEETQLRRDPPRRNGTRCAIVVEATPAQSTALQPRGTTNQYPVSPQSGTLAGTSNPPASPPPSRISVPLSPTSWPTSLRMRWPSNT